MNSEEKRREQRRREQERKAACQVGHQQQNSEPSRPGLLRRIVDHPITLLIGLIGVVVGLLQATYDALRSPDISLVGSQAVSKLFEYPFAVKNNSILFSMRDAQILCGIADITAQNRELIRGASFTSNTKVTIKPDEIVNYGCRIGVDANAITSGHIVIWVKYRTLFIPRTFEGTKFTWYTAGSVPQWINRNCRQ